MNQDSKAPEGFLPPLSLDKALERGRALTARGELADAEQCYRDVLALAPHLGGTWMELADVLERRGAAVDAATARRTAGEVTIEAAAGVSASLLGTPLEAMAPAVLRKAVNLHPTLPSGPLALAELLRRLGDLSAARQAVRECLRLDAANQRALSISAALDGRQPPVTDRFVPAAPVVVIDDFLDAPTHDALLAFALERQADLVPSVIGGKETYENWRRSRVDLRPEPARQLALPAIMAAVASVAPALHIQPEDYAATEVQFTAHNDGDFYKRHRDRGTDHAIDRRLAFVYYLHRHPRGFSGGALRLFDSMLDASHCVDHAYTRVEPVDNRLVVFPSHVWHEVEPVRCPSGDYADGRFTLNGWGGLARS